MSKRNYPSSPIVAASVAIWRDDQILLASRSKPPNAQRWAMPGGVVELGETLEQAAIREVKEETALELDEVQFLRFHEVIEHDENDRTKLHYVLAIFAAKSAHGDAMAGDDAAAVCWYRVEDLPSLPMTGRSEEFILQSKELLEIG